MAAAANPHGRQVVPGGIGAGPYWYGRAIPNAHAIWFWFLFAVPLVFVPFILNKE